MKELNISIIENKRDQANFLAEVFTNISVINGDALDQDILTEAGIKNTETFVSLTNNDEVNILSALLAKRSGAIRAVTLINKPSYIDGLSFLPLLTNKNQEKHEYLYWEFSTQSGQQAVRYGKWKGVKTNLQNGPQPLQLYNLEDDIKELNNISNDNPNIVKKIESIILNARTTPALEKFKIKALDN